MRALLKALLCLALVAPGLAAAQAEYEVKAAYLFRFLSFVEWPAQAFARPDAPLVIGVLGEDDVYAGLQEIVAGRQAQGRPLSVRRVKNGEGAKDLHVLFVGRAAAAELPKLPEVPGQLVVSEGASALDRGAVITFVRSEGRVRFEVALDAAERRGLRLSSRLLAVAQYVRPGKP